MTDQERELHIADCGHQMRQAFAEGRRADAYGWMDKMNQAIRSRSPEQVRAMEMEHFGCYFAGAESHGRGA